MANDRLARAVLELTTEHGDMLRGLDRVSREAAETDQDLARLKRQAASLGRDLQRSLDSVSGRRLVQEALVMEKAIAEVGDVSQLTARELQRVDSVVSAATAKLRQMGQEVPASLQQLETRVSALNKANQQGSGLAAMFGQAWGAVGPLLPVASLSGAALAVVSMGKAAFDSAGHILDLSNQTDLSTDTIQQMQEVANQTGTELEAFTSSAFKLGVNLAEGTDKVKKATEDLGLSYEQLRASKPDEQWNAVIGALERVENQQERNRLGVTLFGKQFKDIAASVQEGYSGIANAATISSLEQLQALDRAGDAWQKFTDTVASRTRSALGSVVLYVEDTLAAVNLNIDQYTADQQKRIRDILGEGGEGLARYLAEIERARTTDIDLSPKAGKTKSGFDTYTAALAAARQEVQRLSAEQRTQLTAALELGGDAAKEYAESIGLSEAALRMYSSASKDGAKSTSELTKAQDALFGRDVIAKAQTYVQAIGGIANVSKLSKEQQAEVHRAVSAALDAYARLGQVAPASLRAIEAATRPPLQATRQFTSAFEPLKAGVQDAGDELHTLYSETLEETGKATKATEDWARAHNATLQPAVKATKKDLEDAAEASKGLGAQLMEALMDIPNILARAFEGGGDLWGAAKSLGTRIGSILGTGLMNALGATGPLGKLLGGVIGSLAGPLMEGVRRLFNGRPVHEDIRRRVSAWAGPISEGLAQAIAEAAKTQFGGNRQAAELFNLDRIIGEAGGLNPDNLATMTGKLRDLFVMVETGAMSAGQAAQVLDKNWRAFVEAGTDAEGRLSPALKEIIALQRRMGIQSKEITAYLKEQTTAAMTAANAVIGASSSQLEGWGKVGEAVRLAREELARLRAAGAGADEIAAAQARLTQALTAQGAAAAASKQELDDLGTIALGAYNAALNAGQTPAQAMATAGPGLAQLAKAYADLGLEIEDAGLKSLLVQAQMQQAAPSLVAGPQALADTMIALDNAGEMNATTFAAMQRRGMEMFTRLQGEAARFGGGQKEALAPMQGYLREAVRQAAALGVPLDENLQILVDQSKELGLWKEHADDGPATMQEAITDLVEVMKELRDFLRGDLPEAAGDAAEGIERELNGIRPLPVRVPVVYEKPGQPPPPPGGNGEGEGFATGVFRGRFPSMGGWHKLHNVESVVPQSKELDFAARVLAERGLTPAQAGAGGAPSFNLLGFINGQGMSPADAAREAVKRIASTSLGLNEFGLTSEIERVIATWILSYASQTR